jgi:hypothetical protein
MDFVVKVRSIHPGVATVEIYRVHATRGRSSLTRLSVGQTPHERNERSVGNRGEREVVTIDGSPPTSAERRAACREVHRVRRALREFGTRYGS